MATMQRTLSDHIAFLEDEITKLRTRLELHKIDDAERAHILKRLNLAANVLDHYRRAHELEKRLEASPQLSSTNLL